MEKTWNWFGKTNKKEAIINELQPIISELISEEVEYLFISPEIGAILYECNNVMIIPNNDTLLFNRNSNIEHIYNLYKNEKQVCVYIDKCKDDIEIIDFMGKEYIINILRINLK